MKQSTMTKQDKYTKSAKGQVCQIRSPLCNNNLDTTVLCHLNTGGMSKKTHSIHGAYGCSSCHDVVDGRVRVDLNANQREFYHLQGVIRTQELMIKNGILKL